MTTAPWRRAGRVSLKDDEEHDTAGESPAYGLDWPADRARAFGHAAVELWAEYLERLRELPVSRPRTVGSVRDALLREVPAEPVPEEELLDHLRVLMMEQGTLTGHPGFVAYISGSGTVPGAVADLIAAAINQNVGGWRLSPGATELELHLMRWFARRLGLPDAAGGVVTTGGAMSAFIGLKAARDHAFGTAARRHGMTAAGPVAIYASREVHDVNTRAADMLGMGSEAVRLIETDASWRMRTDALRDAILRDAAAGVRPLAVVATAGTVATGAIDPLEDIADICAQHGLWLHVDGAYGGVAALTDTLQPLFRGIGRADSVVLDPHKWLYTPHSGGIILVRDMRLLSDAFGLQPSYTFDDKALSGNGPDLYSFSPNFSRGFHALKIWVSLLAHGWSAYSRRIVRDTELAATLHALASAEPELVPASPQSLSIACFRYVPADLRGDPGAEPYIDRLNERLMTVLQASGRVFPSNAVLDGRFHLRACIVNFRTERRDLEELVRLAVEHGRALDAELRLRPSSPIAGGTNVPDGSATAG